MSGLHTCKAGNRRLVGQLLQVDKYFRLPVAGAFVEDLSYMPFMNRSRLFRIRGALAHGRYPGVGGQQSGELPEKRPHGAIGDVGIIKGMAQFMNQGGC